MSSLSPAAIAAAQKIGREHPPLTQEQKALVTELFGPLLRQWAAEDTKPKTRRRAA